MVTAIELLNGPASQIWDGHKDGARSHARAVRAAQLLTHTPIEQVTVPVLEGLVQAMRDQGLGPGSINRHMAALRKLLRWAHGRGLLSVVPPQVHQREPKGREAVLGAEDAVRCVRWFKSHAPAYAGAFEFIHQTGCRVSEAFSLTRRDVQKDPKGVVWATFRDTKNGGARSVPLQNPAVLPMKDGAADGRIFAHLKRSTLSHLWVRCRQELGLEPALVLHSLRHTRASSLVNAGVPLAHVGAWLGHRSLRSTLRYSHTDRNSLERAMHAMTKGGAV